MASSWDSLFSQIQQKANNAAPKQIEEKQQQQVPQELQHQTVNAHNTENWTNGMDFFTSFLSGNLPGVQQGYSEPTPQTTANVPAPKQDETQSDNEVIKHEFEKLSKLLSTRPRGEYNRQMAVSRDVLALVTQDSTITVTSLHGLSDKATFTEHSAPIFDLASLPNSKLNLFASISIDGLFCIWQVIDSLSSNVQIRVRLRYKFTGFENRKHQQIVWRDPLNVFTFAGKELTLLSVKHPEGEEPAKVGKQTFDKVILDVTIGATGFLYVAFDDSTVGIFDLSDKCNLILEFKPHPTPSQILSYLRPGSTDFDIIFTISTKLQFSVWMFNKGTKNCSQIPTCENEWKSLLRFDNGSEGEGGVELESSIIAKFDESRSFLFIVGHTSKRHCMLVAHINKRFRASSAQALEFLLGDKNLFFIDHVKEITLNDEVQGLEVLNVQLDDNSKYFNAHKNPSAMEIEKPDALWFDPMKSIFESNCDSLTIFYFIQLTAGRLDSFTYAVQILYPNIVSEAMKTSPGKSSPKKKSKLSLQSQPYSVQPEVHKQEQPKKIEVKPNDQNPQTDLLMQMLNVGKPESKDSNDLPKPLFGNFMAPTQSEALPLPVPQQEAVPGMRSEMDIEGEESKTQKSKGTTNSKSGSSNLSKRAKKKAKKAESPVIESQKKASKKDTNYKILPRPEQQAVKPSPEKPKEPSTRGQQPSVKEKMVQETLSVDRGRQMEEERPPIIQEEDLHERPSKKLNKVAMNSALTAKLKELLDAKFSRMENELLDSMNSKVKANQLVDRKIVLQNVEEVAKREMSNVFEKDIRINLEKNLKGLSNKFMTTFETAHEHFVEKVQEEKGKNKQINDSLQMLIDSATNIAKKLTESILHHHHQFTTIQTVLTEKKNSLGLANSQVQELLTNEQNIVSNLENLQKFLDTTATKLSNVSMRLDPQQRAIQQQKEKGGMEEEESPSFAPPLQKVEPARPPHVQPQIKVEPSPLPQSVLQITQALQAQAQAPHVQPMQQAPPPAPPMTQPQSTLSNLSTMLQQSAPAPDATNTQVLTGILSWLQSLEQRVDQSQKPAIQTPLPQQQIPAPPPMAATLSQPNPMYPMNFPQQALQQPQQHTTPPTPSGFMNPYQSQSTPPVPEALNQMFMMMMQEQQNQRPPTPQWQNPFTGPSSAYLSKQTSQESFGAFESNRKPSSAQGKPQPPPPPPQQQGGHRDYQSGNYKKQ